MKKFIKITSTCLPIRDENIDTDQIVPARFLKIISREGFGKYLFYDWRFDKYGKTKKNNRFDDSNYHTSKILIAGNNFGCGSSREHAVWAIMDYGSRVVISSSFGDIFYNNALKNGLLPVTLKLKELEKLFQAIEKDSKTKVKIDLESQTVSIMPGNPITRSHLVWGFPIDPFRKSCLLKGVDELGYILSQEKKIKEFERKHKIYIN